MKQATISFLKSAAYLFCTSIVLWGSFVLVTLLIAFSYAGHALSWIPYILLGNWAPGKLYGLTIGHSLICVFISILSIRFFDKKIDLGSRSRLYILLILFGLFLYEAVFNFFFQTAGEVSIDQFRQAAILQASFCTGILLKAFDEDKGNV